MLGQKPDEDIRLPMQWSDEDNAGFTTGNPWRAPNSNFIEYNVETMAADENSLFNHYRELIQLRNELSELKTGKLESAISSSNSLVSFVRYDETSISLVVINLSSSRMDDFELTFTDISLQEKGASYSAETYDNEEYFIFSPEDGTVIIDGSYFTLEPYETKIFEVLVFSLSTENLSKIETFILHQNYPNPFNPATVISYQLAVNSIISLKIFDALGREVAVLEDGLRNAGSHTVNFDASTLSSGVYFYRLEAGDFVETRK